MLLSKSWSNPMHILIQTNYIPTCFGVAITIIMEEKTTDQKPLLLSRTHRCISSPPLQHRAVYFTPPTCELLNASNRK